jgi:hypothetical protein
MFEASWMAVLDTVSGNVVVRVKRVGCSAGEAAFLGLMQLLEQISLHEVKPAPERNVGDLVCRVRSLPYGEATQAKVEQGMWNSVRRREQSQEDKEKLRAQGFMYGQQLPDSIVQVDKEVKGNA